MLLKRWSISCYNAEFKKNKNNDVVMYHNFSQFPGYSNKATHKVESQIIYAKTQVLLKPGLESSVIPPIKFSLSLNGYSF